MDLFSKGKRKAVSGTLLDCGKILLATLVASDFIKFNLSIKLLIVVTMVVTIVLGIIVTPDEEGEIRWEPY